MVLDHLQVHNCSMIKPSFVFMNIPFNNRAEPNRVEPKYVHD